MFDISLLGVWIPDETLHIVFHVLLLSAWISDERILRVFYILLRILGTIFLVLDILLTEIFFTENWPPQFFFY